MTRSLVEPRVKLVNDTLEPDDSEQSARDSGTADEQQDCQTEEAQRVVHRLFRQLWNGIGIRGNFFLDDLDGRRDVILDDGNRRLLARRRRGRGSTGFGFVCHGSRFWEVVIDEGLGGGLLVPARKLQRRADVPCWHVTTRQPMRHAVHVAAALAVDVAFLWKVEARVSE